jgi:hypothetical protein
MRPTIRLADARPPAGARPTSSDHRGEDDRIDRALWHRAVAAPAVDGDPQAGAG